MNTMVAKLVALGSLIFLTLIFSSLPYFLVLRGSRSFVSAHKRDKVIAYLNCLAGGVFLGTLLLHLLTEGSEEFEQYMEKALLKTDYPLYNLFVAGGFFLVAFIELVMHSCLHHEEEPHNHEIIISSPESEHLASGANVNTNQTAGQYGALGNILRETDPAVTFTATTDKGAQSDSNSEERVLIKQEHQNGGAYVVVDESGEGNTNSPRDMHKPAVVRSESQGMNSLHSDFLQAFLLLIALSFHTIFDGLAVGLQKNGADVWEVFTAIALHKSIIAFCLGLELYKSHPQSPWKAFVWLCFFALMSPIGIGLGILLTSDSVNELARMLASSILQGVAAGTFLYVTFLEILCMYVGHHGRGNFWSVFFALIGFSLMAAVKIADHD